MNIYPHFYIDEVLMQQTMKRQLAYDHYHNEERTKLRTMINTKKCEKTSNSTDHRLGFFPSRRDTMNCFENLPNELIYEIFDYLDGCLLYDAFSNLNIRFHTLLVDPSFRLRINFNSYSEEVLERWCRDVILPNKNRIISFSFNNVFGESPILFSFPVNSGFWCLQSLTLIDIRIGELSFLLAGLIFLPRLSSLTISILTQRILVDLRYIYQLIFNLPALKYNKLSSHASDTILSLPRDTHHRFQTIEYLLINHSCTINDLVTILACTPRLTHLVCEKTLKANVLIEQDTATELRYLTNITLHSCCLRFDQLETFLRRVSSQVEVLRIHTYEDSAYLNADCWENLITLYIPQLRIFQFRHKKTISHHCSAVLSHHQQDHRFTSAFWIERKWIFGMSIRVNIHNALVVVYSIQPYRMNEMFGYQENSNSLIDAQMIVSQQNESIVTSQTNQLTITNLPETEHNESFMDTIRYALFLTPITRLNLTIKNISTNRLVELVRLLPNLEILVIGSLATSSQPKKCQSAAEVKAFRDLSNSNKITKIILEQSTKFAQIQFLIELCPHVQHFEVVCCDDVSPESFLLFILIRNNECLPNLSSICLRMANVDEETMFKIQTIMHLENRNYTIKQINNRIYLRWRPV